MLWNLRGGISLTSSRCLLSVLVAVGLNVGWVESRTTTTSIVVSPVVSSVVASIPTILVLSARQTMRMPRHNLRENSSFNGSKAEKGDGNLLE